MDRARFSFIAHRPHAFCNPIGEAKISRIIELLNLQPGDHVIDFGSGKAELLIRLIERYSVHAVGVEVSALFAEEGRRRAPGRVPERSLTIFEGDARQYVEIHPQKRFALAACVGATHALGGLERTLDVLKGCVEPGGKVLVGEGYWKRTPAREYLELLGGAESDLLTHGGNVSLAASKSLVPLWAYTADDAEWDEYEWLYSSSIENYIAENSGDPEAPAMRNTIRRWREGYLAWGRDTLGFGLYLFRSP